MITIQHYDPVQDGWLTRYVNHLRYKLLSLPPAYSAFIDNKLFKGGTLVYLVGLAEQAWYRIGPNNYFQVGGYCYFFKLRLLEFQFRYKLNNI